MKDLIKSMELKLVLSFIICIFLFSLISASDIDSDDIVDEIFDNCVNGTSCIMNSTYNNCYNPDQRDLDGDGEGDRCDICPATYGETCSQPLTYTGSAWVNASANETIEINNKATGVLANLTLFITPGALNQSTTITFQRTSTSSQPNFGLRFGTSATFIVAEILNPNGTAFNFGINISIKVSSSATTNLSLWLRDKTGTWKNITSTICSNVSTIWTCSGLINNFSEFTETTPVIRVLSPINTTYTNNTVLINGTSNQNISNYKGVWIANWNGTNVTLDPTINITEEIPDGSYHLLLYTRGWFGTWGVNDTIYFSVSTTGAGDTCTPPAINTDWIIYFNDNCTLSVNTDLGTGKIYINGTSGSFTLNASLTTRGLGLTCTPSGGCKFGLMSGKFIFT